MPARLAVYLPTYKRPDVLQAVADNVQASTYSAYTLYFGLEANDEAGIVAAAKTGATVVVNKYEAGYANTIQTIYEQAKEPFFIHANDDFLFLPNWDKGPLAMFETPSVMVVGLRQTEGDTHGSAISMVRRSYIEDRSGVVDMPNRVFFPYNHNYVDTEFTQTAQHRGVWAMYPELVIVHQHPGFTGKEKDDTHKKNDDTSALDQRTFESRRYLFS